MAKRNLKRAVSALVALVMVLSIAPGTVFAKSAGNDGSPEMNEAYANRESLMPIGPSFNVDTLLEWTPESDPDAAYSRASIPLADRSRGFVVNPLANPEAKLMLYAPVDASHDYTSAQGTENFKSWSFNYWQYADTFAFMSASEEGFLSVPTGELIDAAHTNGVPVVASLAFESEVYRNFLQKAADGSFAVADKLIQLMDYYGFDGYFINVNIHFTQDEMKLLEEIMRDLHRKRPDMLIVLFDSIGNDGSSEQNCVNWKNQMFLEPDENGVVPADEFFLNYHWDDSIDGESLIDITVNTMNQIDRSPYDAFAGVFFKHECMNSEFHDDLLVDADGRLRVSLGLDGPNSTLRQSVGGEDFHKLEQEFYTNKAGDPRENSVDLTTGEWAGMSRFLADKTPITTLPFVTDFNSGHGRGYYVNGQLSRDREWSYQSVQDVMPTWTWIIDSVGTDPNLTGSYEFDTVYNGGSSIAFEGSLTDPAGRHNVMLYSTDLLLEAGQTLELVSKLEQGSPAVSVVLYLDDGTATDYETCEKVLLPASSGNDWTGDSWALDAFAGKTLRAIGFEMDADGKAIDAFRLILGRLAILDQDRPETEAPAEVRLEDIRYLDANRAEARLSFSEVNDASGYRISQVMADGTEQVIMDTPNNYFYIPTLIREAGEAGVTLKVAGINRNGVASSRSTELYIPWKYRDGDTDDNTPQDFTNLCLRAEVVEVSEEQEREPASKALDGTAEDNSKWCARADSGWMVIDLGEPQTVKRWRVEHAECGGESAKMNTCDFDLQYFDEASQTFKVACEIRGNTQAVTDVLLDTPVTAQKWKLNITDSGRDDFPAVRIYEWQMFSADRLPSPANVPMDHVRCINNPGTGDLFTMTGAPAGLLARVYQDGNRLAEGTVSPEGTLELTVDLGTAGAGKVQYCLVGEDGQESPRLCAEFFAEGSASEKAEEVSFELYHQPGSKTAYNFDGTEAYTVMTVSGLAQGDIVRVYGNGADAASTRQSAPVAAGASSAAVSGVSVATAGDTVLISVQRAGQAESGKYEVASPAFPGATAAIELAAYNNQGESIADVQFELVRNETVEGQLITTDSGVKAEVPLGTYTIRCTGVPLGYTLPETGIEKVVSIEGWFYPITVQIAGEAADPEAAAAAEQAQKDAEAAAAAAEQAQKDAETASKDAEAAAADPEIASKAAQASAAAQQAAADARQAADDARTAAETANTEIAASNWAAAREAAAAAAAAREAAETAQKTAGAAALSCTRYSALCSLKAYVDEELYRASELERVRAAVSDGTAAISAAETAGEVDKALTAAKAAIDEIPTAEEMKMPFTDVKEGDWFEYAVSYVYRSNLFKGVSDTEFAPRNSMTRAQMVTVLYRLAGEPKVEGTLGFRDVGADAYYADAVRWGVQNHIVTGTGKDTFSPNNPVTRAQAAVFLYRYAKAGPVEEDHLAGFADAKDLPAYAVDALNWAVANEILTGTQNGENLVLDAARVISRAEVAALFMRMAK